MEIENTRKSVLISKMKYISVIAFIVVVIVLLTTELIRDSFLGMNKYHWAIIVTLLYILEIVYEYVKEFNYIYFNDEGEKLLFRYISLKPFHNKRFSIEMDKTQFQGYKILRSAMNLRQKIIFFVKTPQGTAKYPPVSITALNDDEFNTLKSALNQYAPERQ